MALPVAMTKKPKGANPTSKPPPAVGEMKVAVVHCMGDDCKATTGIVFPGPEPFGGAKFLDAGWSVLNEPEEGALVFACKECFEKEMKESEESDSPTIRGEG